MARGDDSAKQDEVRVPVRVQQDDDNNALPVLHDGSFDFRARSNSDTQLPIATLSEPPRTEDAATLLRLEREAHASRMADARGPPLQLRSKDRQPSSPSAKALARTLSSHGSSKMPMPTPGLAEDARGAKGGLGAGGRRSVSGSDSDLNPHDAFWEGDGDDEKNGDSRERFLRIKRLKWFRKRKLLSFLFFLGLCIFGAGSYYSAIDSRRKARSLMLVAWFLLMGLLASAFVTLIQKLAEFVFVKAHSESVRSFCSTLLAYMNETVGVMGRAIWLLLTLVGVSFIVPENRNQKWRATGYHLPRVLGILFLVEVARIITVLVRMHLAADFNTRTLRPKFVKSMNSEYLLCTLNRRAYNPLFLSLYTYLRQLTEDEERRGADLRVWQTLNVYVSSHQVDGSELSKRSLKQRAAFGATGEAQHSTYTRFFVKQLFDRLYDLCEGRRRLRMGTPLLAQRITSDDQQRPAVPQQQPSASSNGRARSQDDIQLRGGRGFWQGMAFRPRGTAPPPLPPVEQSLEGIRETSADSSDTIVADDVGDAEAEFARDADADGTSAQTVGLRASNSAQELTAAQKQQSRLGFRSRLSRLGGTAARSDSPMQPQQLQSQGSQRQRQRTRQSTADSGTRERNDTARSRMNSRSDRRRIYREDFCHIFKELTAADGTETDGDERRLLQSDPAQVWETTFDQAGQGHVTATRFANVALGMFEERRNIGVTLLDSQSVIKSLDTFVLTFLLIIVIFVALAIYQIDFLELFVAISSIILGFAFIFGESIKNAFENLIWLFVSHPYDVGDSINFPPEYSRWVVKRINLYTTELVRWDGFLARMDNGELRRLNPLYNFNTSSGRCLQPAVEIDMECITPEFVSAVREDLRAYIKSKPDTFTGEVDFHARDMRDPFKMYCIFFAELVAPFGENIGKTMRDQSDYNTACAEIIKRHGGRYTRPYDRLHTAPYPAPAVPYKLTPTLPDVRGEEAKREEQEFIGRDLLQKRQQIRARGQREDAAENYDAGN